MPRALHVMALMGLAQLLTVTHASAQAPSTAAPAPSTATAPQTAKAWLDAALATWLETYKHLHAHPELSLAERETAALVANKLQAAGYQVHTGIGGHGVVGLMRNGEGPTLMLRGDMDALPIIEETGLPHASRVRVPGPSGGEVGVMHACGHDMHVANLLATATFLSAQRARWSGTLMIVAQPAEEVGEGASNMIADRLFERFGRPDFVVALHVDPDLPSGQVGHVSGFAFANVDSVDITIHGRGGHGARPHDARDPIVTAAHLITALQTLVSRRVDPLQSAVVTVGSIHAGTKHNVIPNDAHLQLTVRSYSDTTRTTLIDGIAQLARDTCSAFKCDKPPTVTVKDNHTPAVYNDPQLTARAAQAFRAELGDAAVQAIEPTMGGEDFARYSRHLKVPALIFRLGTVSPEALARSRGKRPQPLPSLHSSRFAPDAARTLETGVRAMSALALSLLGRP